MISIVSAHPTMPALDDVLLRELLDLSFNHACERPFGDLVDVDRVMAAMDIVAEPERMTRWQKRVLFPLRERILARAAESKVLVEHWFAPQTLAKLRLELAKPSPIPRAWIDEMVGDEKIREAVRSMLNEALTSFVQKASATLTDNKSAGSGGLRGAIGWGARAAGSVLGGIGEEVQQRLQDRVRDHVDGAVANVQTRIAERLKSDETTKAIGKRKVAAFEKFLKKTEAEVTKNASKFPWHEIDENAPWMVQHNLARPELREAIRAEFTSVLTELSQDTLGKVLDDLGLREAVREALFFHGVSGLRDLVRTPAFEAWWARANATSVAPDAS
jgi:hypothetical protein